MQKMGAFVKKMILLYGASSTNIRLTNMKVIASEIKELALEF